MSDAAPADPVRILLLEDSPLDAELIEARLASEGLATRVTRVEDRAGFFAALHGDLDLILSDFRLPTFDGHEALEAAREHAPELPFLFVSGAIGEDLGIDALKRGATDYVLKSRLERLGPAVRRALREKTERLERSRVEAERDALFAAEQRARQAAERTAREHRLLAAASETLAASLRIEETLPRLVALIVPEHANACAIAVDGRGEVAAAARDEASRARLTRESGPRSVVPIQLRGELLGLLTLVEPPGDRWIPDELARRIAMAIDAARLYDRAEQANRSKDAFLAALSHELRTPLNGILGWATMLQAGRLDEARRARAIEVIVRNARLQAQLIDDLLDVSRIVAGKIHLERVELDLASAVEMAVEAVRPQADAKGVSITLALDARGALIFGDATRLQQVAWNLLTNAVKFSREGGSVRVEVVARGDDAVLAVADDGEGIPSEMQARIFERFVQVGEGSARVHGGLGLGLAIVKHLVELHGGRVRVESEGRGRGSRFAVEIPRLPHRRLTPLDERAPRSARAADTRLERLRVLVVDDEIDAREMLEGALRAFGAEVETAGSASEAIALAERAPPDVIVSDLGMPEVDGWALARRIRAFYAGPLVAVSAYASAEDRARARDAGFSSHIAKPIDPAELAGLLAELARVEGQPPSAQR